MKLYTIQPLSVYAEILRNGEYICDVSKSSLLEDELFSDAYRWLVDEMSNRIGNTEHIKSPVWAWFRKDGRNGKPDLRKGGYNEKGTKCVCLTLEIPDESVCLTSFDGWHMVLYKSLFVPNATMDELDKAYEELDSMSETESETEIVSSWNKIFQKEVLAEDPDVQATFWKLKKEHVKAVQYFTAR